MALACGQIDAHDFPGARFQAVPGDVESCVPDALNRDAATAEIITSRSRLENCPDAGDGSVGGRLGGVTSVDGRTPQAGDIGRLSPQYCHVIGVRPDVLACDVGAAEAIDRPAHGLQ